VVVFLSAADQGVGEEEKKVSFRLESLSERGAENDQCRTPTTTRAGEIPVGRKSTLHAAPVLGDSTSLC
jgi:hypothetical protein